MQYRVCSNEYSVRDTYTLHGDGALQSPRPLRALMPLHAGKVNDVCFSADNMRLLSIGTDQHVVLSEVATGAVIMSHHNEYFDFVLSIDISRDSSLSMHACIHKPTPTWHVGMFLCDAWDFNVV